MSLLARRFPGRDSYPGDIFYIHSKLLERGGNFKHPKFGEVAISILPVVEIVEGDLTSYVSTNIMGITDGHIYFDSNMFYKGMRPAVNIPLSVTRVGRQTQTKLNREINKELTAFLNSYDKLQNLSHFGQELTDEVKNALRQGDLIYDFFNQPYQLTVPINVQLIILALIMLDGLTDKKIMVQMRAKLTELYADQKVKELIDGSTKTSDIKVFKDNVAKIKDEIYKVCSIAQQTPVVHAAPSAEAPTQAQPSPPQAAPVPPAK